ncbi:MAG TPA: META domain-containing protein [Candidatus Paceibacterota bacterium]|nr:META domain-containing protein [Candidatus Paceibacterota bacterium]
MNRRAVYVSLIVLVLGILIFSWYKNTNNVEETLPPPVVDAGTNVNLGLDIRNGTYVFDGRPVKLVQGTMSEQVAPGSASFITTKFFGNETYADLNNDGKQDAVFFLTQEQGGSGTFYYVAVALAARDGLRGSEAYFVGDRIAPQSITVNERGIILVNYADRGKGQSFAEAPTEGKTLRLKLDIESMRFGVVADIPGEADPARMTLGMKTWKWQSSELSDKTLVTPKQMDRFSLAFTAKNQVTVGTDCNRVGGEYVASDGKITFNQLVSTEMFCENSQESTFTKELTEVTNYLFTDRGELRLMLKNNGGTMIFK